MKKKPYLIILLAFIFISCEEVYINDDNTFCSIEKEQYLINEPIQISLYGTFDKKEEVSWLEIILALYNSEDVSSKVSMNVLSEKDNVDWNYPDRYSYDYKLPDDGTDFVVDFNEKIIIAIPEPGSYRLNISLISGSKLRKYGGIKSFHFNFTVVSSEQ